MTEPEKPPMCPACGYRDANPSTGLCSECEGARFAEAVEDVEDIRIPNQEEAFELIKRLPHGEGIELLKKLHTALFENMDEPTMAAFLGGRAKIVLSVFGSTIEQLP